MRYKRFARPIRFVDLTVFAFIVSLLLTPAGADRTAFAESTAQAAVGPRFLDSSGNPLVNKQIRLLCYDSLTADTLQEERLVTTDEQGKAILATPLPPTCTAIAALRLTYEQPSTKPAHGPAYQVYAASWRTGSGTPLFSNPLCALACPVDSAIIIRDEWPLVLFNVVVGLEWNADAAFLNRMATGLRAASIYLADLTDGYMAFGPVTIYADGQNWDGSDLRFQSANDVRPGAYVGGIVTDTVRYSAVSSTIFFQPGSAFFGRYWGDEGAMQGPWDEPNGYRTLAHEWAHYALFLYDEYQQTNGAPTYCVDKLLAAGWPAWFRNLLGLMPDEVTAASAMAFQYKSSELWHTAHTPFPADACTNTDQARIHGENDWETLARWYDLQGLTGAVGVTALQPPVALPEAGPTDHANPGAGVLKDLFGPVQVATTTPPTTTEPTFDLLIDDNTTPGNTLAAQLYLLKATAPPRILYQGMPTGTVAPPFIGQITLLGADAEDDLRLFVDRYTLPDISGTRFIYPKADEVADLTADKLIATENQWGSSLDLQFGMTQTEAGQPRKLTNLRVVMHGDRNEDLIDTPPTAEICVPDAAIGCPAGWRQVMTWDAPSNEWRADFAPLPTAEELPEYGMVRITAGNPDFDGLIRWFRDLGGVGPTHMPGARAPLRDSMATVDLPLGVIKPRGPCDRVIVMPAADYQALQRPLPPGVNAIVGLPLDIDVLAGQPIFSEQSNLLHCSNGSLAEMRLTIFYQEADVVRLGNVDENQLVFLHLVKGNSENGWQLVKPDAPSTYHNTRLNWLATTIKVNEAGSLDGIYAIGWRP